MDDITDAQTAPQSTTVKSEPSKKKKKDKGGNNMTTKLEDYEMVKNIGEGAFGTVNLAIHKATREKVAIKAVNIMRICELNKERHILREKELLNELKHTNIIQLFATFKVSQISIFIQHFCVGRKKPVFCVRDRNKWDTRRPH